MPTSPHCLGPELCSYISVYFKAYPIPVPFSSSWSGMWLLMETICSGRQLGSYWELNLHPTMQPLLGGLGCPEQGCKGEHLTAGFQGFTILGKTSEHGRDFGLHNSHLFPVFRHQTMLRIHLDSHILPTCPTQVPFPGLLCLLGSPGHESC